MKSWHLSNVRPDASPQHDPWNTVPRRAPPTYAPYQTPQKPHSTARLRPTTPSHMNMTAGTALTCARTRLSDRRFWPASRVDPGAPARFEHDKPLCNAAETRLLLTAGHGHPHTPITAPPRWGDSRVGRHNTVIAGVTLFLRLFGIVMLFVSAPCATAYCSFDARIDV